MGNPVSHAEIHPLETKKDERTLLDLHKLFRSKPLPAFACFQVSRQTGTERKQGVSVKVIHYKGIPGFQELKTGLWAVGAWPVLLNLFLFFFFFGLASSPREAAGQKQY